MVKAHRYILIEGSISMGALLKVSSEQHHHVRRVLRLKEGDIIGLLDGKGGKGLAYLINSDNSYKVIEWTHTKREPIGWSLILACVKEKAMKYALQKATELGVRHIFLAETEFAYSYNRSYNKYKKIVEESCKQCGLLYFPSVHKPCSLEDIFNHDYFKDNTDLDILTCSLGGGNDFLNLYKNNVKTRYCFIIGPEGGLSKKDKSVLKETIFLSLTPYRVLRTETAVACVGSWIQALLMLHGRS